MIEQKSLAPEIVERGTTVVAQELNLSAKGSDIEIHSLTIGRISTAEDFDTEESVS